MAVLMRQAPDDLEALKRQLADRFRRVRCPIHGTTDPAVVVRGDRLDDLHIRPGHCCCSALSQAMIDSLTEPD